MVLEVAILDIKVGMKKGFEEAFSRAESIISAMDGYISHSLQKCLENSARYILLVEWQTLEHHTEGFRKSGQYQEWVSLLHHFYEPFPSVEHFVRIDSC